MKTNKEHENKREEFDKVCEKLYCKNNNEIEIVMCAWCKKIEIDGLYRVATEDELKYINNSVISHGICPACFEKEMNKMS